VSSATLICERRFDPTDVRGVPPYRPRLSKGRDIFEPPVEKLSHGRRPAQRRALGFDFGYQLSEGGLSHPLSATHGAAGLDRPAIGISAHEHPEPLDARTTLGHGAFRLDSLVVQGPAPTRYRYKMAG
jgi:hypothetical protein